MRDVDEQVLLLERLDVLVVADGALDLERGGRDGRPRDHDPRVELVLRDVVHEGAHLLDADGGVRGEFHPHGADLRGRGGVFGGRDRGVLGHHGGGGAGGEVHFFAAVF